VGASPTRPTLQPEATGAVMEVTKWLNRRVEGEAFPLNENVAGKPAEPKPPNHGPSKPTAATAEDGD
jgi:hypothetical protein